MQNFNKVATSINNEHELLYNKKFIKKQIVIFLRSHQFFKRHCRLPDLQLNILKIVNIYFFIRMRKLYTKFVTIDLDYTHLQKKYNIK